MPSQSDPLTVSLSRSFLTALAVLGDAARAEALVVDAVESLGPDDVTGKSIRDAVIRRLVQAQIAGPGIHTDFPAFTLPA